MFGLLNIIYQTAWVSFFPFHFNYFFVLSIFFFYFFRYYSQISVRKSFLFYSIPQNKNSESLTFDQQEKAVIVFLQYLHRFTGQVNYGRFCFMVSVQLILHTRWLKQTYAVDITFILNSVLWTYIYSLNSLIFYDNFRFICM